MGRRPRLILATGIRNLFIVAARNVGQKTEKIDERRRVEKAVALPRGIEPLFQP
jgi:hypothetical protein